MSESGTADPGALIGQWPVDHAAAAVVAQGSGTVATHGDCDRIFRLASVTKIITAYAVLLAVEEGAFGLEDPAGPPGSTVRHLLAHAAGYGFDVEQTFAHPGHKRIYSNTGFQHLARFLTEQTQIPFTNYVREGVLEPLGMTSTTIEGPSGAVNDGALSSVSDLTRLVAEVFHPTLLHPQTVEDATTIAFPDLDGILPGYGMQRPNPWGLGLEIRGNKSPHWTGTRNSPATFGHFGSAGTFIWWDRDAGLACVALTDRDFGDWAVRAWAPFSDAVLLSHGGQTQRPAG